MDPLSQILSLMRPREVGWRVIEGHDAWTLHLPPRRDIVVFGHMLEGSCRVSRAEGHTEPVSEGDFFLMASPDPWSMHVLTGGPSVGLKALFADPSLIRTNVAPKQVTRFVGGYFSFAATGAGVIGKLMLPIVHVRAGEKATGRLAALLEMLGEEATSDRAGRAHVLERVLELILVEALRHPGIGWREAGPSLLKGFADAKIAKALRSIHEDVGRTWTVADLAQAAGMSRSAFADRFAATVGVPPMSYLAHWRMTLARQALAAKDKPMADIAELAGYQSVSAFSTAFRRLIGTPPMRYRADLA